MVSKKRCVEYGIITIVTILVVWYLLSLIMGIHVTDANAYNTYALQADSWRQGRLDLGQDYPWLELAILDGKYYCSFPPFPSYVLFPLTIIFGSQTPDFFVMLLSNLLIVCFLYKLAIRLQVRPESAMLFTIFVTLGSNTLFIMMKPFVWFFAQLLCFLFTVLAIYYAEAGKGGWALLFWAASVGCRPMQIFFLPVLLVLLFCAERKKDTATTGVMLILRRWYWAIPMSILAVSYMLLNYFRFGSITEFGHNYLPEFVRAKDGQFHINYMKSNLKSLFRLPQYNDNGTMLIDTFGNISIFIASPIIVMALMGFGYAVLKKNKKLLGMGVLIIVLSMVYLLFLTAHKTLGGWQFGNRYAIDILPYIYLLLCKVSARYPGLAKYCVPLCAFGICINIVGTVIVYNGLS